MFLKNKMLVVSYVYASPTAKNLFWKHFWQQILTSTFAGKLKIERHIKDKSWRFYWQIFCIPVQHKLRVLLIHLVLRIVLRQVVELLIIHIMMKWQPKADTNSTSFCKKVSRSEWFGLVGYKMKTVLFSVLMKIYNISMVSC